MNSQPQIVTLLFATEQNKAGSHFLLLGGEEHILSRGWVAIHSALKAPFTCVIYGIRAPYWYKTHMIGICAVIGIRLLLE